jgi:hypothetical protein
LAEIVKKLQIISKRLAPATLPNNLIMTAAIHEIIAANKK